MSSLQVKNLFDSLNVKYVTPELDHAENGQEVQNYLIQKTGQKTVPMTFIKGEALSFFTLFYHKISFSCLLGRFDMSHQGFGSGNGSGWLSRFQIGGWDSYW